MKMASRVAVGFLALILCGLAGGAARAQQKDKDKVPPPAGLVYRAIGPFRGGRVLAVTGVAGDPQTFYFGAVSGGVWKTTNAGVTWTPLTDKQHFDSVGAIAVAPSEPSVVYVGTGESCLRGNITYGDGMYRTPDGGNTWVHIGLENTEHIARVVVDPRNSNTVLVAAFGHAFGPNPERGIYRTTDGGQSWQRVLYVDENTGGIDLSMDPSNPNVVFAALYQARRYPWDFVSGGPGSGLYKSTDGGITWNHLEGHGLPEGPLGRIGVAVSGGDSNRVYALIEAKEGGLYRSEDAGATWKKINADDRFRQRAWYFTHIFADPKSSDTLYILNTGLFKSTDAGATFSLLPAPHGDHHGLWIDPVNPKRMINGNDGGATISVDGGNTWTTQENQPTAQFYHVTTDNDYLYGVYGAQQDNSTIGIASRTVRGYIGAKDWDQVGGGESGYIAVDPRDSNIVYAGDNAGRITKYDKRTGEARDIEVWPDYYSGHGAGEQQHRFQWTAPILISPNDPNTLYIGGERIFKTADGGQTWTAISPDLTRHDPAKLAPAGGPITKDNTSVEYYDTVFTIAESPVAKGEIWAGSDDGLIHLTRDGGAKWDDVTPAAVPPWSTISLLEASPHDAATAYAAVDRHRLDDRKAYIYVTHDYGKTWKSAASGIPEGSYVHAVREDTVRKGLLFAGTETGIFTSSDDGAHWRSLQGNLPQTPVHDLAIKGNDLVVATHGRSFWILDDISPLRQMNSETDAAPVHLFAPATGWRDGTGGTLPARFKVLVGENNPTGMLLYYSLKEAPKDEITLDILDSSGKTLRHFSSKHSVIAATEQQQEWPDQERPTDVLPALAGLNRFAWDLQTERPEVVKGVVLDGGAEATGATVPPGRYSVRLTVAGKSYTQPIEVKMDPRVKTSPEALAQQFALAEKIRASFGEDSRTINEMHDVKAQLESLKKRLGAGGDAVKISAASDALLKKMEPIENALINPKIQATEDSLNYPVQLNDKLWYLASAVDSSNIAPTASDQQIYQMLAKRVDAEAAAWKELKAGELEALNTMVRKANIPAVAPSPAPAPAPATAKAM